MSGEVLRLFLALPLSVFRDEIERFLVLLKRNVPGIKWVLPEQVHLTLHFFGDTPSSGLDRLDEALRRVVGDFPVMELRLTGMGGFPDLKRPNVLWAGVEDREGKLPEFENSVRKGIAGLGYPVETRPFRPHATLGRTKSVPPGHAIHETVSRLPLQLPIAFKPVDRLILYKSELRSSGAVHEIVREFPFNGAA
ncbi:MAG TPA: RNA 2',3'-cyclic phosphodiesterase [Candidatus Omnitrophota bacterium]|nr:MAG: 2',5' RNA ligase family [Candidatus Omnitrophica bacterium ADurb.Bin314]HQB94677.1 RNA 2',3'-cyclic phosphodiesterase [Candidatus Omnitrophota bacterium]